MNSKASGFTLIEIIIYIACIGLVAGSFIAFSLSVINSRSKTYVIQEVQANNRMALDLISRRIRDARGINASSSVFGTDPGVLSLSMADSGRDPTVIELSGDDGRLQITEGVDPPAMVTVEMVRVTDLVFTTLAATGSPASINIKITSEYGTNSDVEYEYAQRLETTVSTRNQ